MQAGSSLSILTLISFVPNVCISPGPRNRNSQTPAEEGRPWGHPQQGERGCGAGAFVCTRTGRMTQKICHVLILNPFIPLVCTCTGWMTQKRFHVFIYTTSLYPDFSIASVGQGQSGDALRMHSTTVRMHSTTPGAVFLFSGKSSRYCCTC